MLNTTKNVYNKNCSIIVNNYQTIPEALLSLNESFAYDLVNLLRIIRDISTDAEPENISKSAESFFKIRSLANVLLDKIHPEQFHDLNDLLKNLKK